MKDWFFVTGGRKVARFLFSEKSEKTLTKIFCVTPCTVLKDTLPLYYHSQQHNNIMTTQEIQNITQSLVIEMGGDAETICSGECTTFAMRLIDRVGRGEVVSNLTADMESEFLGYDESYEIVKPEIEIDAPTARNYYSTSHCWVKIDGRFYDAFNTDGVEDENDLVFVENCIN